MGEQIPSNPYAAPPPSPLVSPAAGLTILRGFAIILVSGAAFALGGAVWGWLPAMARPGYYRGVFRGGDDPSFVPWQVGLGLGLTQGLIVGLIVGAVVVLAVAWYDSRRAIQA